MYQVFLLRICVIFFSLITQEISRRIPLRTHANSQESTKETLLSQDVAVSLLQENKMALKRCELVSKLAYILQPSFTELNSLHPSLYGIVN